MDFQTHGLLGRQEDLLWQDDTLISLEDVLNGGHGGGDYAQKKKNVNPPNRKKKKNKKQNMGIKNTVEVVQARARAANRIGDAARSERFRLLGGIVVHVEIEQVHDATTADAHADRRLAWARSKDVVGDHGHLVASEGSLIILVHILSRLRRLLGAR